MHTLQKKEGWAEANQTSAENLIQDALNNRQHQSNAKASIMAKTVMAIRRGKSEPLPAGAEDGSGVEEMPLVGMGAGVGSWSLPHAGCVPLAKGALLLPLPFVCPLYPADVDVEVGVELTADELLLASIVGVLETCHLLVPSVRRAYDWSAANCGTFTSSIVVLAIIRRIMGAGSGAKFPTVRGKTTRKPCAGIADPKGR